MLRLRELRIENEKTQSEMAEIFGVSRQVYANYENGINEPSLEMLIKMADFFSCSVDFLLSREDDFGSIAIGKENSFMDSLSTEEKKLLEDYRSLSPALQEMLQATICTWKGTNANTAKMK